MNKAGGDDPVISAQVPVHWAVASLIFRPHYQLHTRMATSLFACYMASGAHVTRELLHPYIIRYCPLSRLCPIHAEFGN